MGEDHAVRADVRTGFWVALIGLAFLLCPGCGGGGADDPRPALMAVLLVAALAGVAQATRATLRARALKDQVKERLEQLDFVAETRDEYRRRAEKAERSLADAMAEIRRHMALHALKNTALVACNELLDGKPGEREWATAREALRAVLGGEART